MSTHYIPYFPETIEGQALLDTLTRSRRALRYRDNDKVLERIQRGMPLYEAQTTETVGPPDDAAPNLLLRGECLSACAYLKAQGLQVDLVYIDPPFASGADYAKNVYLRRHPDQAAQLQTAETELDLEELRAFEEKMYGDIWNKEDYLNWMYENLQAIKAVMSDNASIYVHLDWNIGHYVKILLDEVFGENNFQNEIIWAYSERGISKTYWNRKHDTIYFYTKTKADTALTSMMLEMNTQKSRKRSSSIGMKKSRITIKSKEKMSKEVPSNVRMDCCHEMKKCIQV